MTLRKTRDVAAKAVLLLSATMAGLLGIELSLRLLYPVSTANVIVEGTSDASGELLLPDEVLGLRPALGTTWYDENGILFDRSIFSTADGAYKMLFIGDSVTAYGRIVDGIAKLVASGNTSFLNGGVAGYNIQQEIEFFFRYQMSIKPDVIIHQMHINDLQASRIALRGRDGTVRIYSPRVKPVDVNQALYQYSQTYRFAVGNLMSRQSKEELKTASFDSLRRMRDYTRENGITYHLILFPSLQPFVSWRAYDKETRDYLLGIARELQLEAIDLQPVAERLFAEGIDPQSVPGDTWHPNKTMGDEAAKYIVQKIPSLLSLRLK